MPLLMSELEHPLLLPSFVCQFPRRRLTNTNMKKVTDNTYVKDRQEKQFT
jgi:hypothetical protein